MGLKDVGCEDVVVSPWEEVEGLGRGVVSCSVAPTLPPVPVDDSVVLTTAPAVEVVPRLEEEEIAESLEMESGVICVVTSAELIIVIRTGSEREVPQAGYGHQLKDEVV